MGSKKRYFVFYFLAIVLVNAFVLFPSLSHNARGDHIYYLAETSEISSFGEIFKYSYDYTRTRVFSTGDKVLFRPLFYLFLSLERYLFGYNFILWQVAGIVLHIIVLMQLFRITKFFKHKWMFLLVALNFSVQFISQEMIIWHHINGYMIYNIFFLSALYQLIEYIHEKGKRKWRLVSMAVSLTLACLIFEFGVVVSCVMALCVLLYDLIKKEGALNKKIGGAFVSSVLVLLPTIIYASLNICNYIKNTGDKALGADFSFMQIAQVFPHFWNLIVLYLKSNLLVSFVTIIPIGRTTLEPLTWSSIKGDLFSSPFLGGLNGLFLIFVVLVLVKGISCLLTSLSRKEKGKRLSQELKIILVLCSLFSVLYMFLLTAARPSDVGLEYKYITNALYHFYNVSLCIGLVLYLLYVAAYEKLIKGNKNLVVMISCLLCLSIALNAYKSYAFNVHMKKNDSGWGRFINQLNRFVEEHKHEKDFSFDVGYTEKTRRGIFIYGDPKEGEKVLDSAYAVFFKKYIRGVDSKYLLVFTEKDGLKVFEDKGEAMKAVIQHLSSKPRMNTYE